MSNLIASDLITDYTVYGVPQMQYTVAGEHGLDFTAAVTAAVFKQTTAIESATSGYSEVIKARQKKIDDLSEALAYIAKANAKLPTDSSTPSKDKVKVDNSTWIKSICAYYEVKLTWDGEKMVRGDLQKAQTELEYQIDKEDNNLEQDMVTLQSYLTKRDNAYSNASKVVKKTYRVADTVIGNM